MWAVSGEANRHELNIIGTKMTILKNTLKKLKEQLDKHVKTCQNGSKKALKTLCWLWLKEKERPQ